tara:strand:+ start:1601 stop:2299 length:699 start_codon:yes stop_codon:yes gene_type:complete
MRSDLRPRLTAKGSSGGLLMQGPATALKSSGVRNSLVFPYTPAITYQRSANYGTYDLAHTNYQPKYYSATQSPSVQVTCLFTNATEDEIAYTQGALHFLRMASLMHFGENDPNRGTPPPVLLFSAYGSNQFQDWPCVVGNVAYTFDSDMDYVENVSVGGQTTDTNNLTGIGIASGATLMSSAGNSNASGQIVLPAQLYVSIELLHQPDLLTTRKQFTVAKMANGSMLRRGYI